MSVCRHELGAGSTPNPPTIPILVQIEASHTAVHVHFSAGPYSINMALL